MSIQAGQPQEPEAAAAASAPLGRGGASPAGQEALVEIFARIEQEPQLEDEEAVSSGREPVLTVPEELTPLPAVDRAMGTLALFGGVIRGKRARYRMAVLKNLQGDRSWRWRIGRLQEIVHWLEPHSVTDIVAELRDAGVLDYDPVTRYYRLGVEGRLIAAIIGAVTVPHVERRRLIKAINKTMSLSLALGASDDIVFTQFQSAVSQLQEDWDELNALIEDMSRDALLAAAHLVQDHVDDMRELLQEHESFLASRTQEKLYLDVEQQAFDLIFRLGELAATVIQTLSGRADELMRAGFHVDRGDIRQFISEVGEEPLATLFADLVSPPPFVMRLSAELAFDALEEASGRTRAAPPPLPEPVALERRQPPRRVDPVHEIAAEAKALPLLTPLVDFVVHDSWPTSVERHSVLIDAYSRYGSEMPLLEHGQGFDEPRRAGVLRISRADLRPREAARP
ncbi:MAG: hypothetical protein IRZ04_17710 [Rhodospirillales bacterium]|nr:hypothetical protein [Rhodospirillales bacterium]